jgi:hypothetical protein
LRGYAGAEPFGGKTQTCQARRGFSECSAWQVSIKYQCLGNLGQVSQPVNYLGSGTPMASAPMSKEDFQREQVQKLTQENVSYEEYQRRYRIIMGQ